MKTNRKVIVLLSTYNGEKYLREQLDSIINQSYNNIEIMVRDDGSKDKTTDILAEYEKKGLISVTYGENVGFIKSFFGLVKNAKKADYYSFADQDDVWLNDKVEKAVMKLDGENSKIPLVYFSDYDFYDADMNYIKRCNSLKHPDSLERVLVASQIGLGVTMVINDTTKKLVDHSTVADLRIYGHDYWFYLIGLSLGKILYDDTVTAKYRRHSGNVSDYQTNFFKLQKERIQNFLIGNDQKVINHTIYCFYRLYKNRMSRKNRELFILFINKKYNFLKSIKKACYPKRFRDGLFDEIGLRFLFLIGKM